MPERIPLVILRGSGETTAQLAQLAAEHGVRTLAHAEGGGVLYVHSEADRDRALAMTEATLDRLGVCNRLNLALVDRGAAALLPDLLSIFEEKSLEVRGTSGRSKPRSTASSRTTETGSATSGRTRPSASRRSRSTSSTTWTMRCGSPTRRRRGSRRES